MPGEDGYFDERVAARYDESSAEMFEPAFVERWSGRKREPFTNESTNHVSVWRKPPA